MRYLSYLIVLFLSESAFSQRIIDADQIRNSARSKTYSFSGTQGTLVTAQSVSGDITTTISGDLTSAQLKNSGVSAGIYKGGVTVTAKGIVTAATASLDLTNGVSGVLPADNGGSTVSSLTISTATSSVKTPSGGNYHQMTNNSLNLGVGVWEIWMQTDFGTSGSNPAYTAQGMGIFAANGADTSVAPSVLGSPNVSFNSAGLTGLIYYSTSANTAAVINSLHHIITVSNTTTIYAVPYSAQTTPANARITTYLNARRLY